MRIKLLEKVYENFEGQIGDVPFKKGVSTRDVTDREADRLAAVISCKMIPSGGETGKTRHKTPAEMSLDRSIEAPMLTPLRRMTPEEGDLERKQAQVKLRRTEEEIANRLPEKIYKLSELEGIADADGISGLREIGKSLGVNSRAIGDLIRKIVSEQNRRIECHKMLEND